MTPTSDAAPSARIAAAEAEIAAARLRLDQAVGLVRRELAVPLAAATVAGAMLARAGGVTELGPLIRRHAAPLALMALGATWLAAQCRGTLGNAGSTYARDLISRVRTISAHAVDAALAAALDAAPAAANDAGLPHVEGAQPPVVDDT